MGDACKCGLTFVIQFWPAHPGVYPYRILPRLPEYRDLLVDLVFDFDSGFDQVCSRLPLVEVSWQAPRPVREQRQPDASTTGRIGADSRQRFVLEVDLRQLRGPRGLPGASKAYAPLFPKVCTPHSSLGNGSPRPFAPLQSSQTPVQLLYNTCRFVTLRWSQIPVQLLYNSRESGSGECWFFGCLNIKKMAG